MPSLTPAELQEARRRSGNLGGRPRKVTVEEARQKALDELVPKALRVLGEALESGRADAWRPALAVLAYEWGRPGEVAEPEPEVVGIDGLRNLTLQQLEARRQRLEAAFPELRDLSA